MPISTYTVHVPKEVRELLETAPSEQAVEQGLHRLNRDHHVPLTLLRTHALHQACARDDVRLVQRLFSNVNDRARASLVNSPLGSHSYTPLCRAAYAGSIQMTKLLVAAGASADFQNYHGENVLSCISNGFDDMVQKMPDNVIFLRERFDECARFVEECQAWEEGQRARTRKIGGASAHGWVPRRVRLERASIVILRWWRDMRARHQCRPATVTDAPASGADPASPDAQGVKEVTPPSPRDGAREGAPARGRRGGRRHRARHGGRAHTKTEEGGE